MDWNAQTSSPIQCFSHEVYVQLISTWDFTFELCRDFYWMNCFAFYMKWKNVLVECDPYPLYSCIITSSLILWDRIELHETRESMTYLISTIGRKVSCHWLNCYAKTTTEIFSTLLVECYFLRDTN
jgi:hypothetical protein